MNKTAKKLKKLLCLIFSAAVIFASVFAEGLAAFAYSEEDLEFDMLGVLSAKYESNGDPAVISSGQGDAGGVSYGAYQFSSVQDIPKAFFRWLIETQYDTVLGWRLSNAYDVDHGYGDTFNSEWKAIAAEKGDYFLKLQRAYVRTKYYNPAASSLRSLGFEVNSYTIALKNVVWSRALQHGVGGAMNVFRRAFEKIGGFSGHSEPELIEAIYNESGITGDYEGEKMYNDSSWIVRDNGLDGKTMRYFGGCSSEVQAGVWLRLNVNEKNEALRMYEQYKDAVDPSVPNDNTRRISRVTLAHITDGKTNVRVRTGPSTNDTIIGEVNGGTRLVLTDGMSGDWYPVRLDMNGFVVNGYCYKDYVTVDYDCEVVTLGDVDSDGQVSVNDALMTLQNSIGSRVFSEKQFYTANVDFIGGVTVKDALLTLQRAVNVIEGF